MRISLVAAASLALLLGALAATLAIRMLRLSKDLPSSPLRVRALFYFGGAFIILGLLVFAWFMAAYVPSAPEGRYMAGLYLAFFSVPFFLVSAPTTILCSALLWRSRLVWVTWGFALIPLPLLELLDAFGPDFLSASRSLRWSDMIAFAYPVALLVLGSCGLRVAWIARARARRSKEPANRAMELSKRGRRLS